MVLSKSIGNAILSLAILVGSSQIASGTPFARPDASDSSISARAQAVPWIAMGDSFAAGPGAGEAYEDHGDKSRSCEAMDGSYPAQLARLPYPGDQMSFLACTGDVTEDVLKKQIPLIDSSVTPKFITLSIGGNDALFAKILLACIFKPPGSANCEKTMEEAETIISIELAGRIGKVYTELNKIFQKDKVVVYHTLYDNFFNADTDWCDGQTMGLVPFNKPKLTKDLRRKMNSLVQEVNSVIVDTATRFNEGFDAQSPFVRTIDPNDRFDGHRFCEEGAKDFGDDSIWFFERPRVGPLAADEDFGGVDIESCADDPTVQNDLGRSTNCSQAVYVSQASDDEKQNMTIMGGFTKTFHPKIRGFTAIRDEVLEELERPPHPTDEDLSVLPVGDSITAGFGSPHGNGYRGNLQQVLWAGDNRVDYVGSQKSGDMEDNDHEGHSGYTISQIADEAKQGKLRKRAGRDPNIVLLHAGTNDMNKPSDPDTAHLRLGALIDQLFEDYPDTTVIVAEIVPSAIEATNQRIKDYNIRVNLEVQSRRAKGKHVWFAWMPVTKEGLGDDLHPNADGYAAMARGWAYAIEQVQENGWIKKPPPSESDECDKLPSWIKQGEIANGAGLGKGHFSGSSCSEAIDDVDEKYCDCSLDDGTEYRIDRGDNDCSDFTYLDVNAVQFADLNGDGLDEYLWLHKNGSVTAFQNMGHEYVDSTSGKVTWWPRGMIASGVGSLTRREQIRFADLNGDGRADYLVVEEDGSVNAWLNVLDGSDIGNIVWVEQGQIAAGIGRTGAGVRFADLNGDGRAEYLYLDDLGAVTCYLNGGYTYVDSKKGKVGWIAQGVVATGVSGGARHNVRFTDTNGDGRADYVVIQGNGKGGALLWQNLGGPDDGPNAGKVKWWERGLIASGPGDRPVPEYNVVFADLNGDGRDEYVVLDPQTSAADMWLNGC